MAHQSTSRGGSDVSKHVSSGHVPDDEHVGRGHDVLTVRRDGGTERREAMAFERVLKRAARRV